MIIQEEDFRLTPINEYSTRFDLELLYIVKPKDKEPRQEFKIIAYSINLETAFKKIAHYRICKKLKEKAIDMRTYLNEFKEELHKLSPKF